MINVCIVGYGAIGPTHAKALSCIDNVNIYAICDIDQDRADSAAKEYNAIAYYGYDECVSDKNIDVVHICTPHYLHYEMICKALDNGKRVVAEKPAVMTRKEFELLSSKYDLTKVFPILQNRTNLCVEELKRIVSEDKSLGKLIGIKGIVTWKRDRAYYNSAEWRGTLKYEGGGVLINQAVHTLDLMVYFAGGAKSVSASSSNLSLEGVIDVEDTVSARINFQSGATGILFATNAYSDNSSIRLELDFENAHFQYADGKLWSDGKVLCQDSKEFSGKEYWGNGHTRTLADYYKGNTNLSLADIKNTMELMFGIYESAKKGKELIL